MKKVLVVVGPTAIGKSDFGLTLAKLFKGEIISGDSIQVYKGLDIGSGKIETDKMEGIKHYGLDILEPTAGYSVYDFQKMARKAIEDISKEGHLPIVVGGTGLYIKACLYDYVFEDSITLDLSEYEAYTNEKLVDELQLIDPKCLDTIHINNRKRLIRALAMAHQATSKSDMMAKQKHTLMYDALIIGLTTKREEVYNRINQRVNLMVQHGLVEEIKGLLEKGVNFDHQSMQGIGYREFRDYFEKGMPLEEVITLIQRNTRHFAKRQYTWFNNQTPIKWFDIDHLDEAIKEVTLWMNNTNVSH